MKVILYGTGTDAGMLCDYIVSKGMFLSSLIVAFCDSDIQKIGNEFRGIIIISPEAIRDCEVDYIVIASRRYASEIKRKLELDLLINDSKVLPIDAFMKRVFTEAAFHKKYRNDTINTPSHLNILKQRVIVYTAITGDYDELKDPMYVSPNVKYICFTNNPNLKSKIWEIRLIKSELDNLSLARRIKILPWEYLEDRGDIIIWVDAKYKILNDLREYYLKYRRNGSMLCFPHFCRDSICDEMIELAILKRNIKKEIIKQTAAYLNDGFPDDIGLYDTGCIVRNCHDSQVKFIMEEWWKELSRYSKRDQLSFPYLCWKYRFEPDICNLYIEDNYWLKCEKHK